MQLQRHCSSYHRSSSSSRLASNCGSSTARRSAVHTTQGSRRRVHHLHLNLRVSAAASDQDDTQKATPSSPASSNSFAPTSAATAAANNAAAAAGVAAPAADTTADAVSRARQELVDSWSQLKDAAGTAFIPGYKQQQQQQRGPPAIRQPLRYSDLLQAADTNSPGRAQQQQQQQEDIVSLPDRVGRLLTGQFIREREAGRSKRNSQRNQQQDTRVAAVQFEMMQGVKQQQQQTGQADHAAPTGGAATDDIIIDVSTDPSTAAAGTAAAAAPSPDEAQSGFYPAGTQVLLVLMWGVFAVQWYQAWPDLWEVLRGGRLLDAAAAVLLAFPDTPATHTLCLDLSALQQGRWLGLLTCGLCHSGLLATWLCCAALQKSGSWLEAGSGQLQLLTAFLITTLTAAAAHLVAGRCELGVMGPGAVLGLYTTWSILAAQYMREVVPLRTILSQGVLLLLVMLGLSWLQPAVSAASLLGGVVGGALAVKLVQPLSAVLRWCLAVPAMVGLLLLKLGFDLLQVVWYVVVFVAAAAYQGVADVVRTVRRL